VGSEQSEKITFYVNKVREWQSRINLVSDSSLSDIETRHVADSLQLYPFLPCDSRVVLDMGSGAGFPIIPLSIIESCQSVVNRHFIAVESDVRKAVFLQEMVFALKLPLEVRVSRLEKTQNVKADIITARALASLDKLLDWAALFSTKTTQCLFLKGKNYEKELENAKKSWNFQEKVYSNSIESSGVIILIKEFVRYG